MRLVQAVELDSSANAIENESGDALAAASLFGIVGGLLFALVVVPTIPIVAIGAVIGAGVGIVVAYN